jgi:hypothetical protein
VPIEGDTVARLRGFLGTHPDPELANELRVRDSERYTRR